jgi:glycosyltransferase involved in cell wall biosynthesis
MICVHVTHEAVEKMGGIGSVIAGLATAPAYQRTIGRTILAGPLFSTDRPAAQRLGADGRIIYSSLDGIDEDGWSARFRPIEQRYQVGIVYGIRKVREEQLERTVDVEVLLVDVFRCNEDRLNLFKRELYEKFSIPSDRFQAIWEYEEYVRLAEPLYEGLHVIGCDGAGDEPLLLLSHEYMGLPTAFKAILDGRTDVRTAFYAHEVASVREMLEKHPGHDLMFYRLLEQAERDGRELESYFPEVADFFKHPLTKSARHCDAIFAVGDYVAREIRLLSPKSRRFPVEIVYNGIPAPRQGLDQRRQRRDRLIGYAENLFGFRPDYIFTHVARPVLSKGIWRDLRLLHELDTRLAERGQRATYYMLGTLAGQRRVQDVLTMERTYGWPVEHRRGYPDLCNGEETPGELFADYNAHHEATKAVLINQFGWEPQLCGARMPAGSTFADVRMGTDVEFGMSVYEPFGISQLEPLSSGGICVVTNVCGCVGYAKTAAEADLPANILVADFIGGLVGGPADPLAIGPAERDAVADAECKRLAAELMERLPTDEEQMAALIDSGWELASHLSWDRVAEQKFLAAVERLWEEPLDGAKKNP